MRSDKQGASRGQATGRKRKRAAIADVIVLSEGSEEEPVVRAVVPKRLVAVGLKPVVVSEETRAHNMPLDL